MRETGFEPAQALSHNVSQKPARYLLRVSLANVLHLSVTRLTTPAFPPIIQNTQCFTYKKLYKYDKSSKFEDGHSRLETPVPFPNTEVKLPTLLVLVPDKA